MVSIEEDMISPNIDYIGNIQSIQNLNKSNYKNEAHPWNILIKSGEVACCMVNWT